MCYKMERMKKRKLILFVVLILLVCCWFFYRHGRTIWVPFYLKFRGKRTVADVLKNYGPRARLRLKPHFTRVGIDYPPQNVIFIGLKEEKVLELWASAGGGKVFIRSYPILAASGKPGPKLREGDRQVPEGLYSIIGLNPNSSFHLSMKLDYPNGFDIKMAQKDERRNLGGDIFIHGNQCSIGCLAMGDTTIEELFVLVSDTRRENIAVIIAPYDFRAKQMIVKEGSHPPWISELYSILQTSLNSYSH